MNEQVVRIVLALIRSVACKEELTDAVKAEISPELVQKLYEPSKSHDMAHIVAQGLFELGLLGKDEISKKFHKQQMLAIYRCQKQQYELDVFCRILEELETHFIPLKGSVLRALYPEPWMRTSCDLDVLIHEEELGRVIPILQKKGYKIGSKGFHDIPMFTESGVQIELHFETVEGRYAVNANAVLSEIWDHAAPKEECRFHRVLSDPMFYFYHIAHMAKHFENGGCGIRPFLDLWVLEHGVEHDDADRNALLEQGGLLTFANWCRKLSDVWFGDAEHDEITMQMQEYILLGGVYGTVENSVLLMQIKKGGRLRYLLSRIFFPYHSIKMWYPILNKHRWLTPIMEVRRWFYLLFHGGTKSLVQEMAISNAVSDEKSTKRALLLKDLGL